VASIAPLGVTGFGYSYNQHGDPDARGL
jgi:hypothetical protein